MDASSTDSEQGNPEVPELELEFVGVPELEEVSSSERSLNSDQTDSEHESESRTMRQKYNIRENPEHSYLNSDATSQPSTSRAPFQDPDPGTFMSIPVFFSSAVVLPGQTIPLTASGIPNQIIETAMEKKYPYIGIMMADFREDFNPNVNIGVLVQVNNFTHLEDGFNIVGSAKQRFRLTRKIEETEIETGTAYSALLFTSNIEVEVLAEVLLPPFHRDLACNFNRLKGNNKQDYLKSVCSIDHRILDYCSTEHTVRALKKWLCLFVEERKVDNALERGLAMFSFWVAANLPISATEKLNILVENTVDQRLKSELEFVYQHSKLACSCGSEKLDVRDLINLNSESMGNCYVNPNGYVHDMFTARKVQNVSYFGLARTEYSWFEGYSWTIMNCKDCGDHMGWKFKSHKLEPAKFFGINRKAIQPVRRQAEI